MLSGQDEIDACLWHSDLLRIPIMNSQKTRDGEEGAGVEILALYLQRCVC